MPDTTTTTQAQSEPPSAEDGWRPDLSALRARLDEIDDKIHDLLMDRARVVEGVARSGKTAAFRPGREAAILRRLLARHAGKLPPQTLVRMWREMLAGTTAMQTAVSVAVFDPTPDGTLSALAREHFGFLTPVIARPSIDEALRDVRSGAVSAAVLPADFAAWAAGLIASEPRLHIIGRLPYWASRPDGVPAADALVVGTTAPDASGADRSIILTHGRVTEMEGMVAEDDPRLPAGAVVVGGYAIPVAGDNA